MERIPFNQPAIVGKELYYIAQVIQDGHAAGDGGFTKRCHALLEKALGVPKVLLTSSCTHALEMAALLLDIQPGDCPVTEDVSDRLLRLPFYYGLAPDDQARVVQAITEFNGV